MWVMESIRHALALVLPLSVLGLQCSAAQAPPFQSAEAQKMRPAALIAPRTFSAEAPEGATVNAQLNDAQITGVLDAIVQGEIAQARVAKIRALNPHVTEFAENIIARRSAPERELADVASLLLPWGSQDSELLARVQADTQGVSANMDWLTDTDFDVAYVAGQIQEFQHAIIILDTRLIPDAHLPALQRITTELRTAIIEDLSAAKALHAELCAWAPGRLRRSRDARAKRSQLGRQLRVAEPLVLGRF